MKSYNPLQNIKERPVVRSLIGAPRAQRKAFRLQQRQRFQELENEIERQQKLEKATAQAAVNTVNILKTNLLVCFVLLCFLFYRYRKMPPTILHALKLILMFLIMHLNKNK